MRALLSFPLAALGAVAVCAAGCSVYDSTLIGHAAVSTGQGGSGQGGGTGGSKNSGPRCEDASIATYPPRPDIEQTDAQAKRSVEAVSVQYTIDLGDQMPIAGGMATHFGTVGLNIDGICTTESNYRSPSGAECLLPPFAHGLVDGPGGIDNAIGADVQSVRDTIGTFTSGNYTKFLQQGGANFIYRLREWNGEPNDPQVRVDIYEAAAFDSIDNPKGAKPSWDGNDVWPIASDSVKNNDRNQPRYFDANAYVANYKVVASLDSATLRLSIGLSDIGVVNLNMPLHGSVVLCNLEQTDSGSWGWTSTNCVLGGRWIANDLVHELGQFPDPTTSKVGTRVPLCIGSSPYGVFKSQICGLIDTYSGQNPTATCDSLSIGVGWTSKPAILGDVFEIPPLVDPCPSNVDPANDCCENFDDAGTGVCNPNGGNTGGASSGGTTGGGGTSAGGTHSGGTTGNGGATGGGGKDASAGSGGTRDASVDH
jgi:hypothetical protein